MLHAVKRAFLPKGETNELWGYENLAVDTQMDGDTNKSLQKEIIAWAI